jgi:hypothetical protein
MIKVVNRRYVRQHDPLLDPDFASVSPALAFLIKVATSVAICRNAG